MGGVPVSILGREIATPWHGDIVPGGLQEHSGHSPGKRKVTALVKSKFFPQSCAGSLGQPLSKSVAWRRKALCVGHAALTIQRHCSLKMEEDLAPARATRKTQGDAHGVQEEQGGCAWHWQWRHAQPLAMQIAQGVQRSCHQCAGPCAVRTRKIILCGHMRTSPMHMHAHKGACTVSDTVGQLVCYAPSSSVWRPLLPACSLGWCATME